MRSVEAGPPTGIDEAKIARIGRSLQSLNRGVSVRVDEGRRKTVDLRFLAGSALLLAVPATAQDRASPASTAAAVAAEPLPILPAPPADARLPVVEPIITNDEFQRSIPPLGADEPALSQPLENIEQFEQRLLGQPVVTAGQPAGTVPATVGTSPSILNDPELSAPLPPLASFDVREVEFADPGPSAAAPEVRYAIRVDGMNGADAITDGSMRALFDSLSVLRGGKGHAISQAMLSARMIEDSKLLQRILHAEGWYDASVETRIDPAVAVGQPLGAVIVVTPGQRYSIATITVTADPTVPPNLIGDSLALKVGEPIVADRVQGAEANVALVLPQQGYPFATVNQRDILLDPETHVGDYTLPVTIGPRGRFGVFKTTGELALGADHVAILARFKPGEVYDSRKVDDLRKALVATGLFSTVAVEPQRGGIPSADGTEPVTMLVTQDAAPKRTLAASAGYNTGQGLRVEGSWINRNLFPPEGALIATAVAGTAEQGASLTFRRSNAHKRDRTFQVSIEALRSRYSAFNALTARLAVRLSYDSTPLWQKPFTYAAGAEILGTVEEGYDFGLRRRAKKQYLIGALTGQVGIDRSDSLLNPTKGFRAQLQLHPEGSLRSGFTPYLRGQVDASAYRPFGDSFVFAVRARAASIINVDRDVLAPSRRFYAGGGGSVRGFGYQRLGPRDPDNRPLGGLSLVEGAAEARYRFGNYGVVGFVDVGQVSTKRIPDLSGLRAGVGIGGRFYTNFGPLRVDVATPLGRRKGESRFNLYVSIGQAF